MGRVPPARRNRYTVPACSPYGTGKGIWGVCLSPSASRPPLCLIPTAPLADRIVVRLTRWFPGEGRHGSRDRIACRKTIRQGLIQGIVAFFLRIGISLFGGRHVVPFWLLRVQQSRRDYARVFNDDSIIQKGRLRFPAAAQEQERIASSGGTGVAHVVGQTARTTIYQRLRDRGGRRSDRARVPDDGRARQMSRGACIQWNAHDVGTRFPA